MMMESNEIFEDHDYDDERRRIGVTRRLFCVLLCFNLGFALQVVSAPALVNRLCDNNSSKAALVSALGHSIFYALAFTFTGFWGGLSDRIGRKPVLYISAVSEIMAQLIIIAVPRVEMYLLAQMSGGFSAQLAILHAAATDICEKKERLAQTFGLFGVAFGIAFVLGPGAGAALFQVDWRLPMLASVLLYTLAYTISYFGLPETLLQKKVASIRKPKYSILEHEFSPVRSLLLVIRKSRLLAILLIPYTLQQASTSAYALFLFYLSFRYNASILFAGIFLSAVGLSVASVQGLCIRRLVPNQINQRQGLQLGCIGQVVFFLLIATAPARNLVFVSLLTVPLTALLEPCLRADLATLVPEQDQGSLNGALFSLRAAAQTSQYFFSWLFVIGKRRSGLSNIGSALPFFVAAGFVALAVILFRLAFHLEASSDFIGDPQHHRKELNSRTNLMMELVVPQPAVKRRSFSDVNILPCDDQERKMDTTAGSLHDDQINNTEESLLQSLTRATQSRAMV